MTRSITVQAIVNMTTGYGQVACEVIAGLAGRGWDVQVKPIRSEESWRGYPADIPMAIKERYCDSPKSQTELLISPLDRPNIPSPGKRTIYLTMFELSRISPAQANIINRAEAVVVPGKWLKSVFEYSGIQKPIFVVPLGIHSEIFVDTLVSQSAPCVFGAGGCITHDAGRKRIWAVIEAFETAFKTIADAELRIKLMPEETISFQDKRIRVNAELMTWCSLARWYQGLTCFVNIATEGWGLMPHQAMCSGRPVIALNYGGSTEFFRNECGYPLDPVIKWCRFGDKSLGAIGVADVKQLRDEMRRVYFDRKEAAEKGAAAAKRAREFTWETTINRLEEVLNGVM